MKGDTNIQHETKIEQIVLNYLDQDPDIRAILEIIRSLELKDSWLAAGFYLEYAVRATRF